MSPFVALGAHVTLAAFVAGVGIGSALVAAVAPRLLRRRAPGRDLLALTRLLPLGLGLALALVVVPAWMTYEPRHTREEIGWPLHTAAGVCAVLLAAGAIRAFRSWRATRRLEIRWRTEARPLTVAGWTGSAWRFPADFPVVAVVGCLRPRLFVSEPVLGLLDHEELAAALAHEAAHVSRCDNLALLLLRSLPDPLTWARPGKALVTRWRAAAERAADAVVVRRGAPAALALAAALVKVGRRLPEVEPLLVCTLHDGTEDLRDRVTRLVEPEPFRQPPDAAFRFAALLLVPLAATALLSHTSLLWAIHRVCELVVRLAS